jgi:hypothetical protein
MWTHSLQRPPAKHLLRHRRHVPTIPRQFPGYRPPIKLWEHLRYLVYLRCVDSRCGAVTGGGSSAAIAGLAHVPSHDEHRDDDKDEELWYVEGLFRHGGNKCWCD